MRSLPNSSSQNVPAIPERYSVPYYGAAPAPEETTVPLSHYFWILKRHRWKILGFVLSCALATFILSSRLTPIYESTVTIDVDRQAPAAIIGQDTTRATPTDADQFLATQVKLIQSDSVLRPVAQQYRLRDERRDTGGTKVRSSVEEDAPVVLRDLTVTRPPNTYLLLINFRSPEPRLASDVANGIANSYLEHIYNIRYRSSASLSAFMEKQLDELKAKMERSNAALLKFERELNVINPEEKTNILSARLLQLNTEYTNAQGDRVRKQAAYNSVKGGSLEAAQVSSQGESLRRMSERLDEAQQKFAEVRIHYGANHPEYKKAASQFQEVQLLLQQTKNNIAQRVEIEYQEAVNREAMLQKAVAATKTEFDRLNIRSYEYQALKREADADKKLYEELIKKIKEAGINSSFQNSSVRIADPARPSMKPVFPNTKLNVMLAFVLSALLALGAAVLSDSLDNTVRDPEHVARVLKTQVIGSMPLVKPWRGRVRGASLNAESTALFRLSDSESQVSASYKEAIRTLRNSILLSDFDHRLRSLLVTSAAPGEGKSTIAIHLAVAHAEQSHRTLLIDGDLRRPSVHRLLGLENKYGLSNILASDASWQDALVHLETIPDLHILPAGSSSRRAADLLGKRVLQILEEASSEYDLVILDAPPLLGFAEPLQIATAVDGVVVIARAGQTHRGALLSVFNTLSRLRANAVGLVLNEVTKDVSGSYYYHSYYGKYYKPNGRG